tara:strand:+ start:46950 stop:47726 length:777 start_codon:yes stop_codon:yes gene_type:complete
MTDTYMTNEYAQSNPVVSLKNGEVFAHSKDVAAYFGKRHADVLRDIQNLIEKEPELAKRNFISYIIKDLAGENTCYFEMDRDGLTLLAMGFTEAKALRFMMDFIKAFNAKESELKRQSAAGLIIDVNDPKQLRGLLLSYSEKTQKLQEQISDLIPSKDALDRISEADGSLCITDAAKALQIRRTDLFNYLRHHGWIYRRPGSGHDLGYQTKTSMGLLEHKVTTVFRADGSEKITEQVRVTPKGLSKLAMLILPSASAA